MPDTEENKCTVGFGVGRDVKYEEVKSFQQQDAWNAYIVAVAKWEVPVHRPGSTLHLCTNLGMFLFAQTMSWKAQRKMNGPGKFSMIGWM